MAFQKIVLKISKKSAIEVKNILYRFNSTLPEINITEKISDDEIEIEFKTPKEISNRVIQKFLHSGFTVKPIDSYTKKILLQVANEVGNSFASHGFVLPDKLDVNKKDFKQLAKIAKDFLDGKKKLTADNRESINDSINFYIDKLSKDAYFSQSKAYDNIQELLAIASNKKLLSSKLFEIAKSAGFVAINISSENSQNVGELINICNTKGIDYLVNAKAAAKFADTVLNDEPFYRTDISIAIKRLNTRWLSTIWDAVENDLSEDEIKNFKKLQSFIQGKRI